MPSTSLSETALVIIAVCLVASTTITSCATSIGAGPMDVVRHTFPSATDMTKVPTPRHNHTVNHSTNLEIRRINGQRGLVGYCADAQVVSRSGPFKIRVLLDRRGRIKLATVTSYPGTRGRKVRSPRFTTQFTGKGPSDPITLGQDIDAMSGATISSRVMTEGIREIVTLIKHLVENPSEHPSVASSSLP